MFEGKVIFGSKREVGNEKKFNIIKLVDPANYNAFEAILDCELPKDLKAGDTVTVKLNVEQRGFKTSAIVRECKKVA